MKKSVLTLAFLVPLGAVTTPASSFAAEHAMRRLVICLDGTLNSAERDRYKVGDHWLYKPTNVLKTCRAITPTDHAGVSQIAFYSEGVGSFVGEPTFSARTEMLVDRAFGGIAGSGFEDRVKAAYRFLVENYQPGDQIFIFGFSRGAAEAQSLARFIDWIGGILHNDDEYYIVEMFDVFRDTHAGEGQARRKIDQIRSGCGRPHHRQKDARAPHCNELGGCDPINKSSPDCFEYPQQAEIQFLGVYETVLSLGSRLLADFQEQDTPTVGPRYAFHVGKEPPTIAKYVRQALAIDERRWDFRPQIWQHPALKAAGQSLVQRWFPGVHSDIGGGYRNDGLANSALQWMIGEAKVAGLEVSDEFLGHYPPYVCAARANTDTGPTRVYEILRGKNGRGVRSLDRPQSANLEFHCSVASLLLSDPTYRPTNLLEYLANHDQEITKAFPAQQDQIRKIVQEFKAKNPR